MPEREKVYKAVDSERDYQARKWGYRQPDGAFIEDDHEVGAYLTILRVLVTKAEQEWLSHSIDTPALAEVRQIVAVGVACLEQHGAPPRQAGPILNARDGGVA